MSQRNWPQINPEALEALIAERNELAAERSRLQELTQVAFVERNAFRRRAEAAEAALARVEAECAQEDPRNFLADLDPPKYDVIERFRRRGPQDEEAAVVCGANGCSNRATGMRKSYVPGWADVPDCGTHTQRSGTARPEAAEPCRHDGSNGTCAECRLAHLNPQRAAGSGRAAERVEGAIKLGANPADCVRGCEKTPGHTGACMKPNPR